MGEWVDGCRRRGAEFDDGTEFGSEGRRCRKLNYNQRYNSNNNNNNNNNSNNK